MIEFLGGGGPDHHEIQVGALGTAVQHLHLDAENLLEVFDDLLLDVGFGGGGQAEDGRRRRIAGLFPYEPADVAVVGPEVVAPLGETVGFVQDPCPDGPLGQGVAHGFASELFGRYQQDRGVPQPEPCQRLGAFRHGQQAVHRHAGADAPLFQIGHLVGHQGDQGRDDHCDGAGLVVAG